MNALPRTPDDWAPNVSLRELVGDYLTHAARLVEAERHVGAPESREDVAGHALAAVAAQHAIAERVLHARWCNVRDALTHGASLDDVAAAMAVTTPEVVAGLTSWAYRQGDGAAVVALLDGAR